MKNGKFMPFMVTVPVATTVILAAANAEDSLAGSLEAFFSARRSNSRAQTPAMTKMSIFTAHPVGSKKRAPTTMSRSTIAVRTRSFTLLV